MLSDQGCAKVVLIPLTYELLYYIIYLLLILFNYYFTAYLRIL